MAKRKKKGKRLVNLLLTEISLVDSPASGIGVQDVGFIKSVDMLDLPLSDEMALDLGLQVAGSLVGYKIERPAVAKAACLHPSQEDVRLCLAETRWSARQAGVQLTASETARLASAVLCKVMDGAAVEPDQDDTIRKNGIGDFKILRKGIDDSEHLAGMIVYQSTLPGEEDSPAFDEDDEWIAYDDLRAAMQEFAVAKGDSTGIRIQHDGQYLPASAVAVVESFLVPPEPKEGLVKEDVRWPAGAWCWILKINHDRIFQAIQEGEITGLSIGGKGVRVAA